MRIACIAASSVPSRTANSIQVMKVCDAIASMGHNVRLWLPRTPSSPSWDELRTHYGLRHPFTIRRIRALRVLRKYEFSLFSVLAGRRWGAALYYVWPLQAAAFASRLGLPTVLELHDRPSGRFGPWLFKQFLRGSGRSRILPITEALSRWIQTSYEYPFDEPFVRVSPMGVDLEAYRQLPSPEGARTALSLERGLTVGYTGHLYSGRGMDLLVDLATLNPEVNFLWVGGEEAALREWRTVVNLRGLENIQLQGFVDQSQIPLYQSACEILLMPYESRISVSSGGNTASFASPMKLFEYLAAGRAILSSDLPVFSEILNDENAILLPPGDVEAWNLALTRLISDPDERERLSAAAKADAGNYSWVRRAQRALEGI